MERWEILPHPNDDDPQRHLLLIRGGGTDVSAILKKFGALCGRPTPIEGEDYNMSFVLHRLTPKVLGKLDAWLEKESPRARAIEAKPAPARTAAPPLAPMPPSFAANSELYPPPPAPEMPPVPDMPPIPEIPALVAEPPAPAFSEPVAVEAPAELSPTLSDILRGSWTFDSLLVGSYNRFAHAAAMSVVSSPGTMYNPLFLYGSSGTGKSHLLQAISTAMTKGLGESGVLFTSGSRLARVVSAAVAEGTMEEVDKKVADSKALFVDDVHLMAVTEQNKEVLAKLFKTFFDRNVQVVITSLYPPRALGALEEALKFSFSKGWSVDMKIPTPAAQKEMIAAVCECLSLQLGVDEVGKLQECLTKWGYQDLTLWIQRMVVLRRVLEAGRRPAKLADMLRLIYDPLVAATADIAGSSTQASFKPPVTTASAQPLAVIVPKGQPGLESHVASLFYEVGSKNGFSQAYRHALTETYDDSQQVGVPFAIAEMCLQAGVTRALVVGPGPESPLSGRTAELGQAVRRILESSGVKTGWIPHAGLRIAAHYLNAHLDFDPAT
jgi:chromosomal replication initiator protein